MKKCILPHIEHEIVSRSPHKESRVYDLVADLNCSRASKVKNTFIHMKGFNLLILVNCAQFFWI